MYVYMYGSYILIIAHGLCSAGLFCLANISYERLGSFRLLINKRLSNLIPSIALWWFLLSSANIAAGCNADLCMFCYVFTLEMLEKFKFVDYK